VFIRRMMKSVRRFLVPLRSGFLKISFHFAVIALQEPATGNASRLGFRSRLRHVIREGAKPIASENNFPRSHGVNYMPCLIGYLNCAMVNGAAVKYPFPRKTKCLPGDRSL